MRDGIDISVVIPVYNAEETLVRTVDSVLLQEGCSFEVILVDDGSTDGSGDLCEEIASKEDCVRVIRKSNGGVSSARNAGIKASRGRFIMFVDADDMIRPGTFRMMYDHDCDFVMAGFEKVVAGKVSETYRPVEGVFKGEKEIARFLDRTMTEKECYLINSPCFKLFRRSIIAHRGISFVEGLSYAEDKIFVMSFLAEISSVKSVSEPLYSYILRKGSLSYDLVSDRHLGQVFLLLDSYSRILPTLEQRYPSSRRVAALYHDDLVSRYVCRILTVFATRRSALLTKDNVCLLYRYMDSDRSLGMFSLRPGQLPNLMLYKIGSAGLTVAFYWLTSSVCSLFNR